MTQNQIKYQEHLENVRHNLASEEEIQRNNLTVAKETNRHNLVYEKETNRHNLAQEALSAEVNAINRAHYERQDAETVRHNVVSENETNRHNRASELSESVKAHASVMSAQAASEKAAASKYQADKNFELGVINSGIAKTNAATNKKNAETQRWQAFHSFLLGAQANYITQSFNEIKSSEISSNVSLNEQRTMTERTKQTLNRVGAIKETINNIRNATGLLGLFS